MYRKLVFIVLCLCVDGFFGVLVFPTESGSAAWGVSLYYFVVDGLYS